MSPQVISVRGYSPPWIHTGSRVSTPQNLYLEEISTGKEESFRDKTTPPILHWHNSAIPPTTHRATGRCRQVPAQEENSIVPCSSLAGRGHTGISNTLSVSSAFALSIPQFSESLRSYATIPWPLEPQHYLSFTEFEITFRPDSADGVLLYSYDTGSKDFLSINMAGGHVEFRFDCGSGTGVLRWGAKVLCNFLLFRATATTTMTTKLLPTHPLPVFSLPASVVHGSLPCLWLCQTTCRLYTHSLSLSLSLSHFTPLSPFFPPSFPSFHKIPIKYLLIPNFRLWIMGLFPWEQSASISPWGHAVPSVASHSGNYNQPSPYTEQRMLGTQRVNADYEKVLIGAGERWCGH